MTSIKQKSFILNTDADILARLLKMFTQDVVYLPPFPTQKGRLSLQPFRRRSTHAASIVLKMECYYHIIRDEEEFVQPFGPAVEAELIPLARERLEVRLRCYQPVVRSYFDELIDAIIDRYPEAKEQKTAIYVDEIDSFAEVRNVEPGEVKHLLPLSHSEDEVQTCFEEIIGENFHQSDWGGEMNDLVSSNVKINGNRVRAVFLLKGSGTSGKLTIKKCGANGDQIVRLVEAPADLYVVQHVDEIDQRVVYDLQDKVEHRRKKGEVCQMCVIDGTDTARILSAYGYIERT
jgi:hypothetical protein